MHLASGPAADNDQLCPTSSSTMVLIAKSSDREQCSAPGICTLLSLGPLVVVNIITVT